MVRETATRVAQERGARRSHDLYVNPWRLFISISIAVSAEPRFFIKRVWGVLAARYRIRYHIPHQAKLLCPLGKLLNPSFNLPSSVVVQTVQEVRPWTGLEVRSGGRIQRAKRSGRGRPTVI